VCILLLACVWSWSPRVDAAQIALPQCSDNGADHQRAAIKNQPALANLTVPSSRRIDVSRMLTWRVPVNIPSDQWDSDDPLIKRERDRLLYALTGYVRLVKLETDCDFHVQVAQSPNIASAQVIVEVPRQFDEVQRELMRILGMTDGQRSKTWKPQPPPKVQFVGFAFLDAPHQSNPPTKEGHGHGPAGVVQTLWELHPVVNVRLLQ